jgi:WD40 repeat protein
MKLIESASFARDWQTLWLAGHGGIVGVDVAGHRPVFEYDERSARAVAETPTGSRVVVRSKTLELRERNSKNLIATLNLGPASWPEVASEPNGEAIVYANGSEVFEWRPGSEPRVLLNVPGATVLGLSPDGSRVAVSERQTSSERHHGAISVLEVRTGQRVARFERSWPGADGVVLDRHGTRLLWPGDDGVMVFDIASHRRLLFAPSNSWGGRLSPDGRWATAVEEGVIVIWDLDAAAPLQKVHTQGTPMAFSPNGQFLAIFSLDLENRRESVHLVALW